MRHIIRCVQCSSVRYQPRASLLFPFPPACHSHRAPSRVHRIRARAFECAFVSQVMGTVVFYLVGRKQRHGQGVSQDWVARKGA